MGSDPAEFRDPEVQNKVLDALLEENRPMAIRQLGESLALPPSIVAGNLGELQAREQVRRLDGEGTIARYEITATGIIRARKSANQKTAGSTPKS